MQDGYSPLIIASQKGHKDVVNTLLANGEDPNHAAVVSLWHVFCVGIALFFLRKHILSVSHGVFEYICMNFFVISHFEV